MFLISSFDELIQFFCRWSNFSALMRSNRLWAYGSTFVRCDTIDTLDVVHDGECSTIG